MPILKITDIHKMFPRKDMLRMDVKSLFSTNKTPDFCKRNSVLKGVSFELERGEVLGVMGRNGCGKSTLLQIIAGIYAPNSGAVECNGSISFLPAMAAGINPLLSMRDNIYLSGILRGLSRPVINSCFEKIVEFSELSDFLDVQVSHFSSGMASKLAFATTAYFTLAQNSEILLLDEVFAGGGDKSFKDRAIKKFEEFFARNMSIVFVSHNTTLVEKYCSRVLILQDGKISFNGEPSDGVEKYNELFAG